MGAEKQAVGVLETRPTDLALEDAELVAEGENFDLERGLGLPAEDNEVEQRADEGVDGTRDHGWEHDGPGRTTAGRPPGRAWSSAALLGSRPSFLNGTG